MTLLLAQSLMASNIRTFVNYLQRMFECVKSTFVHALSDMLSGGLVYLFHTLEIQTRIQMTHCNGQWKTRDKLK